ncbi:hypothetical protein [Dongia sp.]|uniref:hypothetical protein n=1 Tax=Dongia sp. TaxID=1977262 RepID=UPI0035B2B101
MAFGDGGIWRSLAPLSLKVWPTLSNPAWDQAAVAERLLGDVLRVKIDPRRVSRKLSAKAVAPIKNRFLIEGLGDLPSDRVEDLYTYKDMSDIAHYGDDLARTRLYQWLKASWLAGRPVDGRGRIFDSDAKIEDYCRYYLDLYRSMAENGYRYSGDDEICLGIAANGEIVHVRRGTHRMAAAHILALPSISARITHLDSAFAASAIDKLAGMNTRTALAQAIEKIVS